MRSKFWVGMMIVWLWMISHSSHALDHVIQLDNKRIYDGAMLVNPSARKLYAGRGNVDGDREQGLWVFDLDPQGELAGTDERSYPNSPDVISSPLPPSAAPGEERPVREFQAVKRLVLSPDGRKLYLGLYALSQYRNGYTQGCKDPKPLVVYDLDEKGEPKGKPRSYPLGDLNLGINDMLLNPKLNVLYAIRYYSDGVFGAPLTKGEPGIEPFFSKFGHGIKSSILSSDSGGELIFGCYGTGVEVALVEATGEAESKCSAFKAGKTDEFIRLARVGRCLWFVMGNQLWAWPLDHEWQPVGEPLAQQKAAASLVWTGSHPFLYVALKEFSEGADPKQQKPVGSRIARFKTDDRGNLGKPEFVSDVLENKSISSMTVDETTGAIYITTAPGY